MSDRPLAQHEQQICNVLDQRLNDTDGLTASQLANMRLKAIEASANVKHQPMKVQLKYASAFAIVLMIGGGFLSNLSIESPMGVTSIPTAMLHANDMLPLEDIAMLEDIEFVQWLANSDYEL